MNIVFESRLLLELKAVENLQPIHGTQHPTNLLPSLLKLDLPTNFNAPLLEAGAHRLAYSYYDLRLGRPWGKE